jgi:alpha-2-macroglobulin
MNKVLPLLLLVTFFLSCHQSETDVRLEDKNFGELVEMNDILVFTFSKNLVSEDQIGVYDTLSYIQFSPKIQGHFRWNSQSELTFIPKQKLTPATRYTANLSNALVKHMPGLTLSGDKEFEFHTNELAVTHVNAYWQIDEGKNQMTGFVNLGFNFKVDPKSLESFVKLGLDGKNAGFETMEIEPSKSITLLINDAVAGDEDVSGKVIIDKAITAMHGNMGIGKSVVRGFKLVSPFKVQITEVSTIHDGSNGIIEIFTTQKVSTEKIKDFVSLNPSVDFTVEVASGSFKLSSEAFSMAQTYKVEVQSGLSGELGGKLLSDYSKEVTFQKLSSSLKFVNNEKIYLSGSGKKNLELRIISVNDLTIEVYKLYENNLTNFRNNIHHYYDWEDECYYYDYGYYSIPNYGDRIFSEKISVDKLNRKGHTYLYKLNFEDKLSNYKGIYLIRAQGDNGYRTRDAAMVSMSDLGLIVKQGKDHVTVFANSVKSTEPLSGVNLRFIGRNNQLIGEASTDENGVALFTPEKRELSGFSLHAVSASSGEDYNYLSLNQTRVNAEQFDVGGKYENITGLQAFIYGERNLYRPGEQVNLSTIIRDNEWHITEKLPFKLEVITPRGKKLKEVRKFTSEKGAFEYGFELASSAMTGRYSVKVLTTADVLLNSYNFSVEEFMPDRIKVKAELKKNEYQVPDTFSLDVLAENFFGPPAANRNYEVQYSVYPKNFYSNEYRQYSFYIKNENRFDQVLRSGETDAEGKFSESFEIPATFRNQGLLYADAYVTVFDETGRPVSVKKTANIYTQDVFLGIGSTYYWAGVNQQLSFPMVAVDKNGDLLESAEAELTVIKHEYKTVLTQSGSYYRYRSQKVERVVESKKLTITSDKEQFNYVPTTSGRYEVRLSLPGASMYVSRSFYAYSWGYTSNSSFKVNAEGQIEFEFDKEKYEPGDVAKVLLKAPFSGKVLITLEDREVVDHFYLTTDKRVASLEIPIKDSYKPNIYISATLIKPHGESDIPLTVAHGYAPIFVENPNDKFVTEVEHVEKSRSRKTQTIKVKSKPNSALTVAIVDEGILQISAYITPDAYKYFYARRALQLNSFDIYPFLFPEVDFESGLPGGGGMDMAKRVNPLTNNRVKLVRFWSGILQTDSKGEVEYSIDIPQFSGKLRVMVLSYDDHAFSSSQSFMTVADPIVLSVALPRFLSPLDTVVMPVVVTNTSSEPARAKIKLYTNGTIDKEGSDKETVDIPANSEASVIFSVNALPQIGEGKVIVSVDALGESFVNETEITVRPTSALQKFSSSGLVKGGKTTVVNKEFDHSVLFTESFAQQLVVSRSPIVEFANDLNYLLRYPYGCIEQTISKAFPQLYLDEMVENLNGQNIGLQAVINVNAGIERVKSMQLYTGGMTYWPGRGTETWWGSVYAAHFLQEAKLAGYNVDDQMLENLHSYLKNKLKERKTFEYYYNYNKRRYIAHKEIAYSLYVLALAGDPQYSHMNYYKARLNQLSLDSKYLLAGAYALAGEMGKYQEILPERFEGEESESSFGGSFYSYLRDEAISLNVLIEVDPDNPQIGYMARHVSQRLKNGRYWNTQERLFSLLALGKLSRETAGGNVTASIIADGKEIGKYSGETLKLTKEELQATDIKIEAEGEGSIYYFWEGEGIRLDGKYKEEDSYLRVRKTFLNRDGTRNESLQFKQNDLVVVRISIEGDYRSYIENVAITDLLPAGFEIENTRVSDVPDLNWIVNRSSPQYEDIRDDRINMFLTVRRKTQYLYYFVRAVSPGTYQMGPVNADAMYNGEYHSYNGAGIIRITR